jgi:hypothetical protein
LADITCLLPLVLHRQHDQTIMYASFESSRTVKHVLCGIILLGAGTPLSVYAHSGTGFLHGFIDGVIYLVTSLQYMMLVIAAGLLPVRGPNTTFHFNLIVFLLGLFAGIFFYMPAIEDVTHYTLVYITLILLGTFILIGFGIPRFIVYVLYGLTAVLLGLQFNVGMSEAVTAKTVVTLGFIISSAVLFSLSVLAARCYKTGWQHISIRVIGSWIVAIASISLVISISGIELS